MAVGTLLQPCFSVLDSIIKMSYILLLKCQKKVFRALSMRYNPNKKGAQFERPHVKITCFIYYFSFKKKKGKLL